MKTFKLFFFAILAFFISCDWPCGDGGPFKIEWFKIGIELLGEKYYQEPIQVYFENGEELNEYLGDNYLSFRPFDQLDREIQLDTLVAEDFVIHIKDDKITFDSLTMDYYKTIVDTLKVEYQLQKIDDRCYDKKFVSIKLYYNSNLVSTRENWKGESLNVEIFE